MIEIILGGRLGNWLFQYAYGRALSLKHNCPLQLNLYQKNTLRDRSYRSVKETLAQFSLETKLICDKRYPTMHRFLSNDKKLFQEKKWGYQEELAQLPANSIVKGYFQTEKYFKHIDKFLLDELSLEKLKLSKEALLLLEQIKEKESIALHVRRKDYIGTYHEVCNKNYYQDATLWFQERSKNPHFFIFSDDIEWCQKNLNYENSHYIKLPKTKFSHLVDFYLMSQCQHQIIANSTFSWWAAWLNPSPHKQILTPNRWFNDEIKNPKAVKDTICESWIPIPIRV